MGRSDLIIVVAAIAVVLIISLVVQQPSMNIPLISQEGGAPNGRGGLSEILYLMPFEKEEQPFSYPVFTIQLVENPFGYPRMYMPESDTFKGVTYRIIDGDRYEVFPLFGMAPHTTQHYEGITGIEWIPVGILEQRRGGVSTIFRVPKTPYWRIKTEVTADRFPGQAVFRYILCDAQTGALLDGGEVTGRGSMRSIVLSSEKEMYLIISAKNIDYYTLTLEVPKEYL